MNTNDEMATKINTLRATIINNQKGSISLIALIIIPFLLLLTLSVINTLQTNFLEMRNRAETYLCMNYQNKITADYLKTMANMNKVIVAAFASSHLPPPVGPKAKIALEILAQSQNLYHVSFLKKKTTYKYCKLPMHISYLKTSPYKTNGTLFFLKRNLNRSAELKEEKWTNYIISKNLRREKIILKTDFYVSSSFTTKIKFQTQELSQATSFINKEGLPF